MDFTETCQTCEHMNFTERCKIHHDKFTQVVVISCLNIAVCFKI